ncbi:hypothetical protein [Nonomuraea sp. NPDC050540]|uniref:hypothetical protein n=1 Tax=Nonomuraea sp. NPDC050540 TaxID=3364367 RepID=UPI0037AF74D8
MTRHPEDWPARLRQVLTADDLSAVLECLRRAGWREMDFGAHHELQAEAAALWRASAQTRYDVESRSASRVVYK